MFPFRRSTQGSRVYKENPWCGRWSALPLAVLMIDDSSPVDHTTVLIPSLQRVSNVTRRISLHHRPMNRRAILRTEVSNTNFNLRATQHACFTIAPAVTCHREIPHPAAQVFNATRLLQSAVPTSAKFVAPLHVRPDSNGGEFLARRSLPSLTAHICHNIHYANSTCGSCIQMSYSSRVEMSYSMGYGEDCRDVRTYIHEPPRTDSA